MSDAGTPPPDPAEDRVASYLRGLRDDAPSASAALVPAVVRRARWQSVVRAPLRAVGGLAAAVGQGAALVLGVRRRQP
jgi:hypothetical protein